MSEFKTVIGLEIHAQLKTKSKMFCGCQNNAEGAAPNSLVCPVCLGLPGVLPVANRQAIEWVVKTGLALNCQIPDVSKFDRKHYYYPDLPKNYQISQYDMPFCGEGYLEIQNGDKINKVGLFRIHLEEDAGKLIHVGDSSLVDLNRAGTPLMEIVTKPEINSPAEAKIFMQELRTILRYLDVSDADMEKGHMRCDANISISEMRNEKWEMGIPSEIKNINSFRMLERALIYEEKRQIGELEEGRKIQKETRGWDDTKGITYSQRSKELAQDYRYFPEPDIPPFEISKAYDLEKIKNEIPELPAAKRKRYQDMGVKVDDAVILSVDVEMADYFEAVASSTEPKLAANWIINELKSDGILTVSQENLSKLLENITNGTISGKSAKEVLVEMIDTGKNPDDIIRDKGLKQVGDEGELSVIIDKIIKENPKPASDIKEGKMEAMGFLVGCVMRETKGQANPGIVNKILKERLKCL